MISLLNKLQDLQSIAVALALFISFPLMLSALFAPHSRAQTNKHPFFHQKAIQTAPENFMGSPDFGLNEASRATL